MKFSSKIQRCELSPMRKFLPYELAAEAKGRKIYHLNIGQPDIETPKAFFDAVKNFQDPVLAYAAAPGVSEFLTAVQGYYANLGIHLEQSDIYATAGGSEALQMALTCILDEGDEILIPEPFYPNYNTFVSVTGGVIRPIPTTPEEGYRYADRARIEPLINEHTRAILVTNPGNPTGVVLSPEEMRLMADIAKEHGLFLISDEVYREFVYGGEPLASMAQFDDAAENVVVSTPLQRSPPARPGGHPGVPEPGTDGPGPEDLPGTPVRGHAGPAGRCRPVRRRLRLLLRRAGGVPQAAGYLHGGPISDPRRGVRVPQGRFLPHGQAAGG